MAQAASEQGWKRARYPLQAGLPASVAAPQTSSRPDEAKQPPTDTRSDGTKDSEQKPLMELHHEETGDNASTEGDSASSRSSSRSSSPVRRYHREATMTPSDGEQTQQEHSPTQGPGMRTLRRSPRSRRIMARISLADMESAASTGSTESAAETVTAETTTEKSPECPLRGGVSNSVKLHKAPSNSNYESDAASAAATRHLQPADRALPASPPETESESDSTAQPTPSPDSVKRAAAEKTRTWHRRAYPLQAAVGHADLKRPLTPPPSTPDSDQHKLVRQDQNAAQHRAYPLQAPISTSSHKRSSPAPPPLDPVRDHVQRTAQSGKMTAPVAPQKKTMRRQKYPLQSPASVPNFQQTLPGSAQSDQTNTNGGSTDGQAASKAQARRRQRYPLQSPASVVNLKDSTSLSKTEQQAQTSQTSGQSNPASPNKSRRRGAYPIQSPASNRNLQQSASVSSMQAQQDGQSTASSAQRLRRRQYPLQSPASAADLQASASSSRCSSLTAVSEAGTEDESSSFPPPPSYASDNQYNNNERAPKVLLPKNIRAVKNAEEPLKGRTIVICLDGTGDKFDDDNSNIVHIVSALKKDDPNQVTYYQAGIGTYNDGGLSSGLDSAMDMAVGSGLGLHVRDAYHFLMHSYKEGDRICIFGFSRGAYTARCLAGMIHKVGLLPPRNTQQVNFAYDFYKKDTAEGWKQSADFKRAFSIDVNVYFLGCFDSVASVGFIPRQLPLSSTPSNKARYFRHAMALDERRAKFKICRYQSAKRQGELDKVELNSTGTKLLGKAPHAHSHNDTPPQYSANEPHHKDSHHNLTKDDYDNLYSHDEEFDTDVSEVWFAGCHADIGGGAVANVERHKLAQIPLRWMIRQAFECNTGIIFKTRSLAEHGLDVHTLWPKYERLDVPSTYHAPPTNYLSKYEKALPPRSVRRGKLVPVNTRMSDHNQEDKHHHDEPLYQLNSHEDEDWTPEQVEDYYDAMSPMNDQLVQAPSWWILEALPVQYKMSPQPGEVVVHTGPNMGLARLMEEYEAHVHWTVLQRARELGYKAAARPAKHTEWKTVT